MGIGGNPERTRALEIALKMLRVRDRFESEIRARCINEGCSDEEIELALDSLRLRRFVDDKRIAKNLAYQFTQRKAWPPAKIEAELRGRGAGEDVIENALRSLPPEDKTVSRYARMQRVSGSALARKLYAIGFSEDAIIGFLESSRG
jgi:SOS response regulatory protein OraA/RecX